ncbi:MAG: S-layer homology domain-containing protein, partial [Acidimicrobiia bacterium]
MTKRRFAAAAALLTALAAIPAIVVASPGFDDVPTSHTFYSDIEWLRDSGVTKGCNPPANTQFCPGDNVTRGQMAAFLHRLATDPRSRVVNIPGEAFHTILDSDTIRLDDRYGATGLAGTHSLYAPVILPD